MAKTQCGHEVCGWLAHGQCHINDQHLPRLVMDANVDRERVPRFAQSLIDDPGTSAESRQALLEALAVSERHRR